MSEIRRLHLQEQFDHRWEIKVTERSHKSLSGRTYISEDRWYAKHKTTGQLLVGESEYHLERLINRFETPEARVSA